MRRMRGFTLVELLVVIGIIGVLIGILLPALRRVRLQAQCVACISNERQIGQSMMVYAIENRGWLFPPENGLDIPPDHLDQRWFVLVLKPPPPKDPTSQNLADWTPKIMLCPADDQEPLEIHTYLLNHHLVEHHVMYSSRPPANLTPSDVVVMGEKLSQAGNYYVETKTGSSTSTYTEQADENRHGRIYGSNYLYLDMHAGPRPKNLPVFGLDPWDFPDTPGSTTQPTSP